MKNTLYLIDGYGVIYKSYFAFMRNPLFNEKGQNVSALFGFFRTLFSLIRKEKPGYLLVAMDAPWPTFRHDMYEDYKANRDETPQDLRDQIQPIKDLLKLLQIPTVELQGFEADDILGTLAVQAAEKGWESRILSSDKDLLQMVGPGIGIIKPDKGNLQLMDEEAVFHYRGVRPDQIIDYLALIGDASDNIPGVKGIGPKTAEKLLSQFDTLEGIYSHLDEISSKAQKQKLIDNKELAFFSQELVRIKTDVPLDIELEDLALKQGDGRSFVQALEDWGLKSLVDDANILFGFQDAVDEARVEIESMNRDLVHYELVQTEEDLARWIDKCSKALTLSLDTETNSTDPMKADLVGICLSVQPGEACYIPIRAPEGSKLIPEAHVLRALQVFFSKSKARLIGQNLKYDKKVLLRWGLDIGSIYFDTMVAAWVLESNNTYGLDALAQRYLRYEMIHFKDIVPKGSTFDQVPLEDALYYAAEDADITLQLFHVLKPLMQKSSMDSLFHHLEMPLIDVLIQMEMRGILINPDELRVYSNELEKELQRIERETYRLAGREFNMQSPKQLQEILFDERGLPPQKKTKTGYSTDTSVLEMLSLMDPVPALILENRGLSKLKSTYVDKLPEEINPETGRIHTNFMQSGTATGRLSSKDPNLQNIPVRDEKGRRIRKAFKAAEDYILVSADYSQIELVMLAHLSQDEGLLQSFRNDVDIHRQTAAFIFKKDPREIDSNERRIAKTINFGVIYGMSAFRLSNELKISRNEASGFIDAYFSQFNRVKDFMAEIISRAEKEGGVYTLAGRYRPIPSINSRNKTEKKAAERMAVNTVIQGSAADIVKKAMLQLSQCLKEEFSESYLLLQVHDEFIFEVKKASLEAFLPRMQEIMVGVEELSLPLQIHYESGKDWGDFH